MLRTTGKRGEKGLPGARGRVSWDLVVVDPPKRGVQSEDRPYRGQAFPGRDKRGARRKEHVVRGQGLHMVPGIRNLKRKNELLVSRGIWRGRVTLKTKQHENTESNKSAVGPNEHGKQRVITRGYMVLGPP